MENLVHFDIAAVIMLFVMLLTNLFSKRAKNTAGYMYMLLVAITMIAAFFNVITVALENAETSNVLLHNIVRTTYLLFHNTATPVFVMYIVSLTRTWHKFKRKPYIGFILLIPYFIVAGLIISNPFTNIVFSFENGVLSKTIVANSLYFFATFYVLLGFAYIIIYRKTLRIGSILVLCSSIPLGTLAVFVKHFFPRSLVEIFCNAVVLMIISMTIQNPEKNVDSATNLRKHRAYATDIKTDFINNNHHKLILINIANYDSIRSLLGYDSTNELLRAIADKMSLCNKTNKAHAELYYLDRGKFRIIVNEYNIHKAENLAADINKALQQLIEINKIEITLDAFVSVAKLPEDIADYKSLMAFGNDFQERVEKTGDVYLASELFKQRNFQLMNEMENIIENAFKNNSFTVYYQPIYSIEKKRFVSAEALLRLIDEEHGFVPPNLFIPVAEKTGAIHKIGDIVLDSVCKFIASDEFKRLNLDYIEINLSVVQCMQRGLADNILATINKYGISPDKINLEITETAANYSQNILIENMTKLISAGVSFSLDDFGTGYSNMARLASLPLKIVKLDKTFVDNSNKPKLHIFLKGTIRMLKDMDMEIVVEGIETEQMVETFSDLNCDFIQGYYYSKPIPKNDFIRFIEEAKKSA